jgi:hypothetical protein
MSSEVALCVTGSLFVMFIVVFTFTVKLAGEKLLLEILIVGVVPPPEPPLLLLLQDGIE